MTILRPLSLQFPFRYVSWIGKLREGLAVIDNYVLDEESWRQQQLWIHSRFGTVDIDNAYSQQEVLIKSFFVFNDIDKYILTLNICISVLN